METKEVTGRGLWVRSGAKEGAPKGHRGGSVEEAHTLICHVPVCVGAQKSALQSPVETLATDWFTAAARVCVTIGKGRKRVITSPVKPTALWVYKTALSVNMTA